MSHQESLFDKAADATRPLAARMRPETLDEVVGQEHLISEGKILRRMIESDQVPSMIFWGPPGVGKTTLARVIAHQTRASFIDFSAVTSGIKEIRDIMKRADAASGIGARTIVFIDEIHRFNKAQQDAFLPFVEKGAITLIGATTENPSFEVNGALLSRCKVFVLKGLLEDEIMGLLSRALEVIRTSGSKTICCARSPSSRTGTPARPCRYWKWWSSTGMRTMGSSPSRRRPSPSAPRRGHCCTTRRARSTTTSSPPCISR